MSADAWPSEWEPITPETNAAADALLERMKRAAGAGFRPEHRGTDGQGAVSFEWWRDKKTLTLYADPDCSTAWMTAAGPDALHEMDAGSNPDDAKLAALWAWLETCP